MKNMFPVMSNPQAYYHFKLDFLKGAHGFEA